MVVSECQVFLRRIEKKTAHVAPMEKAMKKKNISCITMISISRRFPIVKCFPEIGKKKRALAVLTEKAMINKTKEGNSLHDKYIKLAETCQELQGL